MWLLERRGLDICSAMPMTQRKAHKPFFSDLQRETTLRLRLGEKCDILALPEGSLSDGTAGQAGGSLGLQSCGLGVVCVSMHCKHCVVCVWCVVV